MSEKKAFTRDCRTGETIFNKADGVCIMAKKGDTVFDRPKNEFVKLTADSLVGEKEFSNKKKGVYKKKVKYRVSLGWVLKKNLKKEDLTREDYLATLGKKTGVPMYIPVK